MDDLEHYRPKKYWTYFIPNQIWYDPKLNKLLEVMKEQYSWHNGCDYYLRDKDYHFSFYENELFLIGEL